MSSNHGRRVMHRPTGMVLSLLIAVALGSIGIPQASAATGVYQGIDVSHWQGAIGWNQVAASGIRFAFVKATEGQSYNDPMYATNRSGAKAAGVVFGAYHFASPDLTPNDAVLEADHFLSVARPASHDLIPALDLEVSNGLSVTQLQIWTRDWLHEVRARLGVKAVIYTSPSFWRTNMGDTPAFANGGYRLLWIANWGVASPDVPASNWSGFSWTFWQWTSSGTVPGISGRVDRDVLKASRAPYVRIP
jgi:GH25 family lysozyme M1 (1,4-beta-N-acetylmuramidase)